MTEFEALMKQHAWNVQESSKAWKEMTEAQARCNVARDREHQTAELLEEHFAKELAEHAKGLDPKFKPVVIKFLR